MEYGYYEDIGDIFDATSLRESNEQVIGRLWDQLEESEDQINEISREIDKLAYTLEQIRDMLEEISEKI